MSSRNSNIIQQITSTRFGSGLCCCFIFLLIRIFCDPHSAVQVQFSEHIHSLSICILQKGVVLSNDDFKAFQGNARDMRLLFKLRASFLLYTADIILIVYRIIRRIFFCTKYFLVHVKKLAKRLLLYQVIDTVGLLLFLITVYFSSQN